MKTIILNEILGNEILSRQNVRNLEAQLQEEDVTLDFNGVTFISRSVADEFLNLSERHGSITFRNLDEGIHKMLEIVKRGRTQGRDRILRPKQSTTFNCSSMEEVREVLRYMDSNQKIIS